MWIPSFGHRKLVKHIGCGVLQTVARVMWIPSFGHRKLVKHYDNGEPHFLTFSCHRRLPLLSKDRTRVWFIEALAEARRIHGFHLWAWVVMPEHAHLLIWPPLSHVATESVSSKGKTSAILADIKRPVGQKAIQYLEKHAPQFLSRLTVRNRNRIYRRFWLAGSGYDENISDPEALHEVVAYVHQNPVRRGLVSRAEDWPWSSARDWSSAPTDRPLCVDRTLPATLEVPWSGRTV
jgi:putative transposase